MKEMEWPKELLAIFDDPLLDGVRPKVITPSPEDRLSMKLAEVREWIERYGREPRKNGDLKEKLMWASMTALRNKNMM